MIAVGREMVAEVVTEVNAGVNAAEKKEVFNYCFYLNIEEILII